MASSPREPLQETIGLFPVGVDAVGARGVYAARFKRTVRTTLRWDEAFAEELVLRWQQVVLRPLLTRKGHRAASQPCGGRFIRIGWPSAGLHVIRIGW